ncbi:MAG: Fe-S biogenesis protein NfuA [Buchnera aphidicola (Periphyllus lyropictus)]|uniref:NifU family protein n=1 Tax=Buchnera aphidicola TaxID=9 RepID=UPI001EC11043|nr:NifU family protein [Buchnera aphidicola]NIH16456.1 Fe-S biogenesis protein NfuA [Buchnera aphidicola (Periphyllus lyropictus)]USS94741.1 NifU family protein [Buchnera aphidicola (Periphyllus lyropictus)]
MIIISKNAQEYIYRLLLKKEKNTHIKIFVKNAGTEKAECNIEYISFKDIKDNEKEICFNKFNVYVNKSDIPFLKKSIIKLVKNDLNFELMLSSPYIKQPINKNFSSLSEEVNYFINMHINPLLLSHGGKLILIKINKKKQAIIEFQGGCNGCSMVSSTLKNMVEKRLLNNFSQLTQVIDFTKHKPNKFSYY